MRFMNVRQEGMKSKRKLRSRGRCLLALANLKPHYYKTFWCINQWALGVCGMKEVKWGNRMTDKNGGEAFG